MASSVRPRSEEGADNGLVFVLGVVVFVDVWWGAGMESATQFYFLLILLFSRKKLHFAVDTMLDFIIWRILRFLSVFQKAVLACFSKLIQTVLRKCCQQNIFCCVGLHCLVSSAIVNHRAGWWSYLELGPSIRWVLQHARLIQSWRWFQRRVRKGVQASLVHLPFPLYFHSLVNVSR